jgi:hypothetical protein
VLGKNVVQFAFLFFVAFGNFMVGVGAAVYLGKAPRDFRFLTQLVDALGRRKLAEKAISEDVVAESPAVESETADNPTAADVASTNTDAVPQECTPTQIGLEETIIDMSAQEVHLRQIGQSVFEDQSDENDWENLLSNITEDIQKLLEFFNEARHLVELEREVAPDASQACLHDLDTQWNAINQQSMMLLVMSSDPEPTDTSRSQLSSICAGVLTTCADSRQSCTTYLANASLERDPT